MINKIGKIAAVLRICNEEWIKDNPDKENL